MSVDPRPGPSGPPVGDGTAEALVLAPLAGDGSALDEILHRAGMAFRRLQDAGTLQQMLASGSEDVLFVLATEEGCCRDVAAVLCEALACEPSWSRLPVVLLLSDPDRPGAARALVESFGPPQVITLARPVRPDTLRSVFALQALNRRRQLETRDLLETLHAAKQRSDFLLRELQHRARNSLSVMQSVFRLTARRHQRVDDLVSDFSERLGALVKAHGRLAEDAGQSASLDDLLREHVLPYCADPTQLVLVGPAVQLDGRLTFDLAMIIHELATNASKYGALSVDGGKVEARWSVDDAGGGLDFVWSEREGPPAEEPTRKGLGTQLIAGFGQRHGISARASYKPSGFVWHATIAAEHVVGD